MIFFPVPGTNSEKESSILGIAKNMKKSTLFFFSLCISFSVLSQKIAGRLVFQPGQRINITITLKTTVSQEAGGSAIDFNANGMALHSFKVTNATDNNSTLHHDVKKITFNFDGMGQKRSFDSDNQKDLDGFFGKPVKDILGKSYDMAIDPSGKTLLVKPERIDPVKTDERLGIVFNLLKDLTNVVYPPKRNEPSFFKVLPETETALNETWIESGVDSNGMYKTVYTLSAITDSTVIVDFKGNSAVVTKAEVMGMQTSTTMNNAYTGQIVLDKQTGIIREKTMETNSTGSTEAMGGTLPVRSKSIMTINVAPQP
jgi:hypothetical protein